MSSEWESTVPAKRGNGEGGERPYEIPSEDQHVAILVAIYDLGSKEGTFQGASSGWSRKVALVWELLDEERSDGEAFYVIREFTHSFNEKAALRDWLQKWLVKDFAENERINLSSYLGRACLLTVKHKPSKDGDRTFVDVASIGKLPAAMASSLRKPTRPPLAWRIGATPEERQKNPPPKDDWLPWLFGKKLHERVVLSPEWNGQPVPKNVAKGKEAPPSGQGRQPLTPSEAAMAGGGEPDQEIPF
jgi:hypothetical protein